MMSNDWTYGNVNDCNHWGFFVTEGLGDVVLATEPVGHDRGTVHRNTTIPGTCAQSTLKRASELRKPE
jgi:hypothetical protein